MGMSWTKPDTLSYEEWEKTQPKGYFIFQHYPDSIHGDWVYYLETMPPTIIGKQNHIDTNLFDWSNIGYVINTPWINLYNNDEFHNCYILPLNLEPENDLVIPILMRS